LPRNRSRLGTELLRETKRPADALAVLVGVVMELRRLDEERDPFGAAAGRDSSRGADQPRRERTVADADHHALAHGPGAWHGVSLHVRLHLVVDALGRVAQRELA
jgi:hypothetical protein